MSLPSRGYAIMELRKTGRWIVDVFASSNRLGAARYLDALRRRYPTRRFQLVEWKAVSP